MKKIQYGVWAPEEKNGDGGYWQLYDTVAEAAKDCGIAPIYIIKPRLVGSFRIVTKPIRVKKRKKAKK